MTTSRGPNGDHRPFHGGRGFPGHRSGELGKAMNLLAQRYPEYAKFPMPKPDEIRFFRVEPKVISVLDYSQGFGHTDLATV